mmetsp:Transcript_36078/g.87087  ORF Transcript_36078/g.87087 Transcript_36078/m.87087 type:complete len:201 (+) Transcript_36078:699-1301(+)
MAQGERQPPNRFVGGRPRHERTRKRCGREGAIVLHVKHIVRILVVIIIIVYKCIAIPIKGGYQPSHDRERPRHARIDAHDPVELLLVETHPVLVQLHAQLEHQEFGLHPRKSAVVVLVRHHDYLDYVLYDPLSQVVPSLFENRLVFLHQVDDPVDVTTLFRRDIPELFFQRRRPLGLGSEHSNLLPEVVDLPLQFQNVLP